MCGIVAQHGRGDTAELERMLERLAHRGPDDAVHVALEHAWLGHRRLSIVDLAGGRQPLETAHGGVYLVGNGEVYNHEDVRDDLDEDAFTTDSDNEVALHLLDDLGPETLGRLNGMYAFVLAADDGRFIAARDPVGIKPLYWTRDAEPTLFASEMHAFPPERQGDVEPFPPGCAWTPEDVLVRFASAVPSPDALAAPPKDPVAGTRRTLIRAVERQMMGDVPV